jgi:ATP-dependent Clp protease ATP-binding subunit ClpA
LSAAAQLSDRYMNQYTPILLPDKAIDLLDEAASKKQTELLLLIPDLNKLISLKDGHHSTRD